MSTPVQNQINTSPFPKRAAPTTSQVGQPRSPDVPSDSMSSHLSSAPTNNDSTPNDFRTFSELSLGKKALYVASFPLRMAVFVLGFLPALIMKGITNLMKAEHPVTMSQLWNWCFKCGKKDPDQNTAPQEISSAEVVAQNYYSLPLTPGEKQNQHFQELKTRLTAVTNELNNLKNQLKTAPQNSRAQLEIDIQTLKEQKKQLNSSLNRIRKNTPIINSSNSSSSSKI